MRRSLSAVTSFVLAAGLIASSCAADEAGTAAPREAGASQGTPVCVVEIERTGDTFSVLQAAVDASISGDTLEIRGTCVGTTTIRETRLLLDGVPTTDQPTPTLDGGGVGRVLLARSAKVTIVNLTIKNGKAPGGAGIWQRYGRLGLRGGSLVTGNTATSGGGGIDSDQGNLTLYDSSSVSQNTGGYGGGIASNQGNVTLYDSSSVTGNSAADYGGGVYAWGPANLTLNDSSSVTQNTGRYGGGISTSGVLTLNDSASVTGNTAEYGGGVYLSEANLGEGRLYVCSDRAAIRPNVPNDPPKVRRVCPTTTLPGTTAPSRYSDIGLDPDDRAQVGEDPDIRSTTRKTGGRSGHTYLSMSFEAFEELSFWWNVEVRLDTRGGSAADYVIHLFNADTGGKGCIVRPVSSWEPDSYALVQEGRTATCRIPLWLVHPTKRIRWRLHSENLYTEGEPEYAPNVGWYV